MIKLIKIARKMISVKMLNFWNINRFKFVRMNKFKFPNINNSKPNDVIKEIKKFEQRRIGFFGFSLILNLFKINVRSMKMIILAIKNKRIPITRLKTTKPYVKKVNLITEETKLIIGIYFTLLLAPKQAPKNCGCNVKTVAIKNNFKYIEKIK